MYHASTRFMRRKRLAPGGTTLRCPILAASAGRPLFQPDWAAVPLARMQKRRSIPACRTRNSQKPARSNRQRIENQAYSSSAAASHTKTSKMYGVKADSGHQLTPAIGICPCSLLVGLRTCRAVALDEHHCPSRIRGDVGALMERPAGWRASPKTLKFNAVRENSPRFNRAVTGLRSAAPSEQIATRAPDRRKVFGGTLAARGNRVKVDATPIAEDYRCRAQRLALRSIDSRGQTAG